MAKLDPVESILQFNAGRDPERLAMKYAKLRESAFAFLRGSCHLFHDRLPHERVLDAAPLAWICGDLHLENFGSYKGDNRLVYFDQNDFDEAVLAPASWDLLRFLTSVRIAAGDALGDVLAQAFLDIYATTLLEGKARWIERDVAQGPVRSLLDGVRERSRPDFLDSRTERRRRGRRIRYDNGKALPASDKQRERVLAFMHAFAKEQDQPAFFRPLDVARRIAGTGSLGVERYIVLVAGKGSPDSNYLLDLKLARPSALLGRLRTPQPQWASEAARVVDVQRRAQAISMAFLNAVQLGKKAFVLRALLPSEDRVLISFRKRDERANLQLMHSMAQVVAWAHLRSSGRQGAACADAFIEFAAKLGAGQKWQRKLLALSSEMCALTLRDWTLYCAAYDDGVFAVA